VRGRLALGAKAPQAIVRQQLAQGGLDRALAHAAHVPALSTMLQLSGPRVRGIKRRAGYFALRRAGRAAAFKRTARAVLIVGPIVPLPAAVGRTAIVAKGQQLARAVLVGILFGQVGEALDAGLVELRSRNPGGDAALF
jgi:hypothetical protein